MPRNVVKNVVQTGKKDVKAVIVTERIVGIAVGEVSVHVEVNRHSHLRALPRVVTRATVVIIIATSTLISILISTLISIRSTIVGGIKEDTPEDTIDTINSTSRMTYK